MNKQVTDFMRSQMMGADPAQLEPGFDLGSGCLRAQEEAQRKGNEVRLVFRGARASGTNRDMASTHTHA